jgi:malate dehydrogenase (oxaloacetate-decarboxylating)(NADP+)
VRDPVNFALMMVRAGEADGFVGGLGRQYPETIRPAIQIIGLRDDASRVSGLHLLVLEDRLFFFADTTVNIEPTPASWPRSPSSRPTRRACSTSTPRVAMLSFSSFGSVRHPLAERVAQAVELVRRRGPGW